MLHDTYGFPIEMTVEIAGERGFDVDVAGFDRLMDEQRERSRRHGLTRRKEGTTA
jgi:alanyl-tRNA synthetase